jgi:hypothetical protein
MQDYTTFFLELFPVESADTNAIARIMDDRMLPEYGPYLTLVSNQRFASASKVVEDYCKTQSVVRHLCVPFDPHANPAERLRDTIKANMKHALEASRCTEYEWVDVLWKVVGAYNHTPLPDYGLTPAYLKMGKQTATCFPEDKQPP